MTEIDDEQPRVPPLSSPPPEQLQVSEDTDESPGDPFAGGVPLRALIAGPDASPSTQAP